MAFTTYSHWGSGQDAEGDPKAKVGADGGLVGADGGLVAGGPEGAPPPGGTSVSLRALVGRGGGLVGPDGGLVGGVGGVVVLPGDGPRLEAELLGTWTSLWADVLVAEGVTFSRGMSSGKPDDRMSPPGTMTFSLRNDASNSAHTRSYYSPEHVNCRAGFTFGIPVRVVYQLGGVPVPLWTGTLVGIDPVPGIHKDRRTHCLAIGHLQALVDYDVHGIAPQVDQTENALIAAVVAEIPAADRPTVVYDTSLDAYPYALYNASHDVKATSLVSDVVASAQSFFWEQGDGALRHENRHSRPAQARSYTFTEDEILDLQRPSDREDVWDKVRTITHPIQIDDSPVELFAATEKIQIAPGQTLAFFENYTDPANTATLIGGTAPFTLDYAASTTEEAGGADVTVSVTVNYFPFAAAVKFEITNSYASTVWLVNTLGEPWLKVLGLGLRSLGTPSFEAGTGDRVLEIDLPYQDDGQVALDMAAWALLQYGDQRSPAKSLMFHADRSPALLAQAVTGDIGHVVGVSEEMTGLVDEEFVINGLEGRIDQGGFFMEYVLMSREAISGFTLDDDALGLLDDAGALLAFA